MKSGSKEQNILAKQGDDLRIDWGYFYMVSGKENTAYSIGNSTELRKNFVNGTFNSASLAGEDSNGNMAWCVTMVK